MAIKKAYVDTPHGQAHYRYGGPENGAPIIFLHQNSSSGFMFLQTLRMLEKERRVYAFDMPGFGGTYDAEPFDDVTYLCDRVMEMIDALGIEEFHICGQHTGGCMAVQMAVEYSDRVKSCMVIGPQLITEEEKRAYKQGFKGSATPDPDGNYLVETWNYVGVNGGSVDLQMQHDEVWECLRSWQVRGWIYGCVWDHDFLGYYKKVACPILIMAAEDDVLYSGFERARNARPDVDAAVLQGSNFEPRLDAPGTSKAILDFLGKHGH